MQTSVKTENGDFKFTPVPLYHGRGAMNKAQAASNLLLFREILSQFDLQFGLIHGTLLGAVRGQDFIDWDEDVDVYMLDEDRQRFHSVLETMRSKGLELVRVQGDLYSLMRGNEYIDVYFFTRKGRRRHCNQDTINSKFLTFEQTIRFLGVEFFVPKAPEDFLTFEYGADWRTPRRNKPAEPWSLSYKLRARLREKFPVLIRLKAFVRRLSTGR